jgi:hypothetical protein
VRPLEPLLELGLLPVPLAQQMVVAEHRELAQVFQLSYSDLQRHFQTCTTDRRRLCQRKLFLLLLTLLLLPALVLAQAILQMPRLQPMSKREVR